MSTGTTTRDLRYSNSFNPSSDLDFLFDSNCSSLINICLSFSNLFVRFVSTYLDVAVFPHPGAPKIRPLLGAPCRNSGLII